MARSARIAALALALLPAAALAGPAGSRPGTIEGRVTFQTTYVDVQERSPGQTRTFRLTLTPRF